MYGVQNHGREIIRELHARRQAETLAHYEPVLFAVALTISLFLADIVLTMAGAFS